MIKQALFIGTIFLYLQSNAQWIATIKDPDGYTNVREEPTTKSPIVGKFYDDEIFHIWDLDYDTIPNWRKVGVWPLDPEDIIEGWVHVSRIQELDLLPEPAFPELLKEGKILTIKNDTIFFQIEFEDFDSTKHEIKRHELGYIQTVDGQYPQGTDGSMPREGIKRIDFRINGKSVEFPKEAYSDLYNFQKNTFKFLRNRTGTIMISSYNSDGAGFYMLVWKFKDNKYQNRFLSGI